MAIINSIAVGKASGKLGNIVFQSYKGRTIARQKNDTISIPPTENQITQQNRFYNCTRSGSFLTDFMRNFKAKNQKGLSFQSYFVKLTAQDFTNIRALRPYQSIRQLREKSYSEPYLIELVDFELLYNDGVKSGVRILFNTLLDQWEDNLIVYLLASRIYFVYGDRPISEIVTKDVQLTAENWLNGYVDIELSGFDTQYLVAYASQYYTYSSNFVFSQVFE